MREAYMKAENRGEGIFSSQYLVHFEDINTNEERINDAVYIEKEEFIPVIGASGLARVVIKVEREKDTSVFIKGIDSKEFGYYRIPNENLFPDIESGRKYISEHNQ